MARRKKNEEAGFNPFIDILTCLAGILILIIIIVVIESKDAKILIPTPILHNVEKEPVFIECARDGALFHIPVHELIKMADEALKKINSEGGVADTFNQINQAKVQNENYRIDLAYHMMGRLVLYKVPEAKGHVLGQVSESGDWFKKLIGTMDPESQMLAFIVRSSDESYKTFRKARSIAWLENTEVAYEVIDNNEPIKFGLGGLALRPN